MNYFVPKFNPNVFGPDRESVSDTIRALYAPTPERTQPAKARRMREFSIDPPSDDGEPGYWEVL